MSNKNYLIDMYIVIILVTITWIFILVPPLNDTPVRTILGIPMVLFFPGYALISALFPRMNDLDGIERLALSFGLSIAVVPLLGLGLNYTPWGIRLIPILCTLVVFTLGMCAITIIRRSNLPSHDVFFVPFKEFYQSICDEVFSKNRSAFDKILTVILVLSIVVSIIMVVYVIVTPKQGEKFTEFYILGSNGIADNYPTTIAYGEKGTMIIGIVNHEYETVHYSMKMELDGDPFTIPVWCDNIPLRHNETFERNLTFTPYKTGTDMKMELLLYKENNYTTPYRDLHLWIDVND